MNGNVRKLVFLMVTVVAPLLLLACATTTSPPRALQGQYVGAGTSTCLFAVCGFGAGNVPQVPAGPNGGWGTGAWAISNDSHSMVVTFEPDGTGTASESIRSVIFNNTSATVPWPSVTGESKDSMKITYTVAPDGTFTMKDVPGTVKMEPASGPPSVMKGFDNIGHISPDGNVLTLFDTGVPHTFVPPLYICPAPLEPKPEAQMSCTATFILYKQH